MSDWIGDTDTHVTISKVINFGILSSSHLLWCWCHRIIPRYKFFPVQLIVIQIFIPGYRSWRFITVFSKVRQVEFTSLRSNFLRSILMLFSHQYLSVPSEICSWNFASKCCIHFLPHLCHVPWPSPFSFNCRF